MSKQFLVIGNQNAITFKETFPYIKENKLWLGTTNNNGMYYLVPKDYEYAESYKFKKIIDGQQVCRVPSVCWFTNLPHNKNQKPIQLTKTYNPDDYPKYDNYDAIEVSKVKDIPIDYDGVMGVPITFLYKYCNSQFEIVKFRKGDDDKDLSVNGYTPYFRVLIKKNVDFEIIALMAGAKGDCMVNGNDGRAKFYINNVGVYARVLIKRKI